MKKFGEKSAHKTLIAVCVLLVLTIGTAAAYAADPGSSSDPVVTKSYVDAAIKEAIADLGTSGNTGTTSSAGGYSAIHLDSGQTLLGGDGTEIILRSGSATIIDNGENGVSDMTSGSDLRTGTRVQQNHLLLVPRNDGRGLKVSTEAYLMVRGGYTLK